MCKYQNFEFWPNILAGLNIVCCSPLKANFISFVECGPFPPTPGVMPKVKSIRLEIGSRVELVCMAGFVSKSPKPMIAECLSSLEWALPTIECVRRGKQY